MIELVKSVLDHEIEGLTSASEAFELASGFLSLLRRLTLAIRVPLSFGRPRRHQSLRNTMLASQPNRSAIPAVPTP